MTMTDKQVKVLRELYEALTAANDERDKEGNNVFDQIQKPEELDIQYTMSAVMTAIDDALDALPTYEVVKFYKDLSIASEVMFSGLEKEEAKEHCNGPDSSGDGWMLGFRAE